MVELEARNGAEHWQAEQLEAATLNVPVSGEIIMHHDILFVSHFMRGLSKSFPLSGHIITRLENGD